MAQAASESLIGLSWSPKIPSFTQKPTNSSEKTQTLPQNPVWMEKSKLVDGLFVPPSDPRKMNKIIRMSRKDTAGKLWFDMPATTMTPEIKKDLELVKLRSVFDPKRFYKKSDSKSKVLPKYFQIGTVIESAEDFFAARLTKKERKLTFADELLADHSLNAYRKRRINEISESHSTAGHEKWKVKGTQMKKRRSKQRKALL